MKRNISNKSKCLSSRLMKDQAKIIETSRHKHLPAVSIKGEPWMQPLRMQGTQTFMRLKIIPCRSRAAHKMALIQPCKLNSTLVLACEPRRDKQSSPEASFLSQNKGSVAEFREGLPSCQFMQVHSTCLSVAYDEGHPVMLHPQCDTQGATASFQPAGPIEIYQCSRLHS